MIRAFSLRSVASIKLFALRLIGAVTAFVVTWRTTLRVRPGHAWLTPDSV